MCAQRLGELVAHHQFEQRASEDRQLEAEARADQLAALMAAMQHEHEATRALLGIERSAAGIRDMEAQQRWGQGQGLGRS